MAHDLMGSNNMVIIYLQYQVRMMMSFRSKQSSLPIIGLDTSKTREIET